MRRKLFGRVVGQDQGQGAFSEAKFRGTASNLLRLVLNRLVIVIIKQVTEVRFVLTLDLVAFIKQLNEVHLRRTSPRCLFGAIFDSLVEVIQPLA